MLASYYLLVFFSLIIWISLVLIVVCLCSHSMQEQIFSFRIWRQLPVSFGKKGMFGCLTGPSKRLRGSIGKIFRSFGAVCGSHWRKSRNRSPELWWWPNFQFGIRIWWASLGVIATCLRLSLISLQLFLKVTACKPLSCFQFLGHKMRGWFLIVS